MTGGEQEKGKKKKQEERAIPPRPCPLCTETERGLEVEEALPRRYGPFLSG